MENNKNSTRRKIAPNFGRDKKRALKILEDEKRAKLGIKTEIPEDIEAVIFEAEVA